MIQKYLTTNKGRFYCAFIDFEKAFDRVNRLAMVYKLGKAGKNGKMYRVLNSMYAKVKSCVLTCDGLTDFFNCPVGVRQGCILSPFLVSFFINDLHTELSQDHILGDDVGCAVGLLKIFYLLFADDLILFSYNVIGLQRLLGKLKSYCDKYCLKVNLDKTKVIVFRNGGRLRNNEQWFYDAKKVDVVPCYSYLGITMASGGTWLQAQQQLADKASKALHALMTNLKQIGTVPYKLCFKIFDTKIVPILHYGSELWGHTEAPAIENVHLKFCKFVLNIYNSPLIHVAVRGELGRHTMRAVRLVRIIKYWLRILNMDNTRYVPQCYHFQCNMADLGKNCWVKYLKDILFSFGFAETWYNQGVGDESAFLSLFRQRCLDIDFQNWSDIVSSFERLSTYNLFKTNLTLEHYLSIEMNPMFKRSMLKFRVSAHSLLIEKGRHMNLQRSERLCPSCQTEIEDEIHFLLVCPLYLELRHQYIPQIFTEPPISQYKFIRLMQSKIPSTIRACAKYVHYAMEKRSYFLGEA